MFFFHITGRKCPSPMAKDACERVRLVGLIPTIQHLHGKWTSQVYHLDHLVSSVPDRCTSQSPQQSCNEDSSKIIGEGRWYWIHDFVATFGLNDRPIYMVLCSWLVWAGPLDTGSRPSVVDILYRFQTNNRSIKEGEGDFGAMYFWGKNRPIYKAYCSFLVLDAPLDTGSRPSVVKHERLILVPDLV